MSAFSVERIERASVEEVEEGQEVPSIGAACVLRAEGGEPPTRQHGVTVPVLGRARRDRERRHLHMIISVMHVCMEITRHTFTPNADRNVALAGAWLLSLTSENTRTAYRSDLLAWFDFLDSGALDALSTERRHADLWRATSTGSSATVARRLSAVSSFYRYAVAEGSATTNPFALAKRPKVDPDFSPTRGLTKSEAMALLDAARNDSARSHALVALLLLTGVRISEALGANVTDLSHDTGHRVLTVTRKGGKRAKVVLPARVIDALGSMLGEAVAHGQEVATVDASETGAPLFTTSTGARWAQSEAFRTVQRLARRAGIEGSVSPHSLRHTHATLALDRGVALRDLQDSLGHADPRTTRRYDRGRGALECSSAHAVAAVLV